MKTESLPLFNTEILIVSQTQALSSQLELTLKKLGYSTQIANHLEVAQQFVHEKKPDLCILDAAFAAPQLLAFYKSLRGNNITSLLPVLSIIDGGEKIEFPETKPGLIDFIRLPFQTSEFSNRIQNLLELSRLRKDLKQEHIEHQAVISEYRSAEKQLLDSEVRFHSFMDNALDIIFILDAELNILDFNQAGVMALGHQKEEVIGKSSAMLMSMDDAMLTRQMLEAKSKGAEKTRYQISLKAKDGRFVPMEVQTSLLFKNGKLFGVQGIARDMTEWINAEQKIKESEEKYRMMVANAMDIIYTLDKDLCITSFNHAGTVILGYSEEEVIGKHSSFVMSKEDEVYSRSMLHQKLEGAEKTRYEINFQTKDGRSVPFEVQTRLLYKEGVFSGVQGIARDITERRKAEQLIKESEELLNQTGELAQVGGWTYNLQTNEIIWTKETYQLSEYDESYQPDINSVLSFYHPDDREKINQMVLDAVTKAIRSEAELRVVSKSGKEIWVRTLVNIIKKEGKPIKVIGVLQDISERKKNEQLVKETNEKYKSLIAQASDGIVIYSLDGAIFEFNDMVCQHTGYSKEEIQQLSINDFLPDNTLKINQQIEQKLLNGESFLFERKIKKKDGTSFDVEINVKMLAGNQLLAIIRNITERKRAEASIQESEAKYRQLFEVSPSPMWLFDIATFEFVDVNNAAIVNYGYSREEFLQMKVVDIRPEVEKNHFTNYFKENNKKGLVNKGIWEHQKKDGTVIFVEVNSNDYNLNGRSCRLVVINDITDKLKVEKALVESEIKFRNIFERNQAGIYQTSISGKIISCNTAFAKMLGYDSEKELIRKPVETIMFSDTDRSIFIEKLQIKGELNNYEIKLKHKEGHPVYLIENCYLQVDHISGLEFIEGTVIDITERTLVEENLNRTLREVSDYKYALDQIANVSITDQDGIIKSVNANFCKHFGYTPEELIGRDHKLINSSYHPATFWENFWQTIQEGKVLKAEVRNQARDGQLYWSDTTIVPFLNKNNEPYQYLAIRRDITEKKKAEREIMDYKFALDQSSIVDVSDEKGVILYANDNFCKISGYSQDEIIGKDHRLLNSKFHSNEFIKELWQTISSGKVWHNEVKNRAKDGRFFWVDTTIVPFLDLHGKPFQFITIRQDITKRKEAEYYMRKAIERYDIISYATSDTIWDWNVKHDTIRFNDGMSKVFGYNVEEVEGVAEWWESHLHPDDYHAVQSKLQDFFLAKQQIIQNEYRFLCADGTYKYVFDRAFVKYNENGKMSRMIGAMQDVSYQKEEEKRIGKAVIDAQEEERNQIGMELHDNVNQILTAASLYVDIERNNQKDKISESLEKSSAYIKDAIQEIRKLSHRLAPGSVKEVSLKGIFESLIMTMNFDRKIRINLQFDDFDTDQINEDIQVSLYRILQEQLSNILKHADATEVDISLNLIHQEVRLVIADNGKGFDPQANKKGIGLNNIRRRVQYYSGDLTVNSSPGKGCNLVAEIPLRKTVSA